MYSVLIVDDEPEIRLGLKLKVDWECLGLNVAGEAGNGAEAMEWLAQHPADVIITDMNMPVMNGVSFLEACYEQYPTLRLIVITGYEDFQYAKAAIRNQARNYLLKPVTQDELAETLGKIVQELDGLRNERDQQAMMQWRLSQYYKEMKEHFLVHLVKEEVERESLLRERAKWFQLDAWESRQVRFVTAGLIERHTMQQERSPDKLRLPFEMLCREAAENSNGLYHVFRDANYAGLMHFVTATEEGELGTFVQNLHHAVTEHLGYEPAIGTGQTVTGLRQWKDGYLSALLAWNLKGNDGSNVIQQHGAMETVLSEETTKVLQRYVARGDLVAFEQAVYKELSASIAASQARFVKLIFQLYLMLDTMAFTAGITLESSEQLWLRPEQVWGFDTAAKAQQFLNKLAVKIMAGPEKDSLDADHSMIQAAEQFIQDNYMYDLNLTMLAERFNYNSSYFSEMFKAKAGKTFIQYITDVRMAKAVQLLEETMLSLWDIAELTGFSNASYFSSKFKRMYGISPSDYRVRLKSPEKFDNQLPKK
ncbi:response regulator [Paenibacillus chondroitinus]|uniref:Response regulator n=1 Tax=Paenibacillus chondroitinus TaxID=59842 RepID=A0ABU6DK97_9BACL|nr:MULTISPECIES: response regulator [Paenibacillus]MCY9660625.1 response regulator [Paenibacillus anseongense]MEB4798195.1 response regulator [Paenibacillus chondroitinus]